MQEIIASSWKDYEFLDSGHGRRLERFGPYILSRPAPQAIWKPTLDAFIWEKAHAVYHRSSTGGGDWEFKTQLPESWTLTWKNLTFLIKPTGFGHVGLFPEQAPFWEKIQSLIKERKSQVSLLNLFAYTGSASLAAASAGASVCHVDGSKGVVGWAAENLRLSNLQTCPVRWIVDDVLKFVSRETRRNARYHGIILDPPSFGRGPKGQVWKIERDLPELMELLMALLDDDPLFILFTCHSANVSASGLNVLLTKHLNQKQGGISYGEIIIRDTGMKTCLPAGYFACWELNRT